jgi:hypothetical protein
MTEAGINDKQKAILKFAEEVTAIAIEKELDFDVIFNGITIVLTAFLLDYSIDEEGLNLDVVEESRDFFVNGLDKYILQAIENVKALAEKAKEE